MSRLLSPRTLVRLAVFPATPGVYVVWEAGHARPLYVGVAATQTIEQRWRQQHLRDRSGGSALRRSLGPYRKLVEKKLSVSKEGRFYPTEVEKAITAFLIELEIEFYECRSADEARALEEELIAAPGLMPRLNVRRPRIKRSPEEKAVLAEAARLFREQVKPAVIAGLRAVQGAEVALDPANSYLLCVEDNLLPGIALSDVEAAFVYAPGHELESKMKAPWSSSALAVNSFARWHSDPSLLMLAGRGGYEPAFGFEYACPNKVSTIDPHLDVLLRRGGEVVAVESKFSEYLQGSDHPPVAQAYKDLAARGDPRAGSRWFAALERVEGFLLLDAYQLVKHYLGLVQTFDADVGLCLVYLYWEPKNALAGAGASLIERHRHEIAEFAALVVGDPSCEFVSLSYERHWDELAALAEKPAWLDGHLEQLRRRYLVELQ